MWYQDFVNIMEPTTMQLPTGLGKDMDGYCPVLAYSTPGCTAVLLAS